MASVSIYLRTDRPKKDGLVPIQIKVKDGSHPPYYHKITNVLINPQLWDADNNCVKTSHLNSSLINRKIKSDKLKLESILLEMDIAGLEFDKSYIERKVNGYDENNVYEFWQGVIDSRRGTIGDGTLRVYETELSKIKQFKSTLFFNEVTKEFLERYESWMKLERKNMPNTIGKSMKRLSYMIDRANETIGTKVKAFATYKKPSERVKRKVFNLDTLDKMLGVLYKKILSNSKQDTLSVFCLQALTGLRFGDAVRFNKNEFVYNGNILINTDKTGEPVYIPIVGRLKELLEFMDYTFPFMELHNANRNLKAIALDFSIGFNLTTHIAVHSFCTTSLDLGLPIEVISKIRGHTNIRTTQLYTQIKNTLIDREMQKWDSQRVS
jgi:integrase